jgi:hypothetical protein
MPLVEDGRNVPGGHAMKVKMKAARWFALAFSG